VLEHYKDKQNAKDVVTRNISKLLLNSLYGKFGMKEIDSVIKIMPNHEAAPSL
jgi:DNA polymerase type B, organellar and viral